MSKLSSLSWQIVGLGLLAIESTLAQGTAVLLYQKNGAVAGDGLGICVAGAGDVNADGKADFIIGAPSANSGDQPHAGSVYVYSGSDGSLLYEKDGAVAGDDFGASVASAGDVNGDGKADFIVGAPYARPNGLEIAGTVYVYSGANGSLLYKKDGVSADLRLGISVASAGDVNRDGKTDFIVGADFASPGGRRQAGSAFVYSGADGSLLYQVDGAEAGDNLGWSVASAGDVNGDGRADFIIGAPGTCWGANYYVGSVYVYSGADGSLLYKELGAMAYGRLGTSVASAGDVNGDGKADFIVGTLWGSPGEPAGAGSAFIYSGADGCLLYEKHGTAGGDWFGFSVGSAGDVNGDGRADFIIGAPHFIRGKDGATGSAFVYSGADGSLLCQIHGTAAGDNLGWCVASAGDVNRDGKDDFIIGTRFANPAGRPGAGSAYVYRWCSSSKGDMNSSGDLTPADIVLMLNCLVFSTGHCDLCFADVNCNGDLTAADVVLELNAVFLGARFPCSSL